MLFRVLVGSLNSEPRQTSENSKKVDHLLPAPAPSLQFFSVLTFFLLDSSKRSIPPFLLSFSRGVTTMMMVDNGCKDSSYWLGIARGVVYPHNNAILNKRRDNFNEQ